MNIGVLSQTRYTTKAFDPEQKIPDAKFEQILTLLQNSPSSVNSQPWHFFVANSVEGKAKIAKAMQGTFIYNEVKVKNASHVIVLCGRNALDETHLQAVLGQEKALGRLPTDEAVANQDKSRRHYVNLHRNLLADETAWIDRQVYLALGALLLGAAALEIDACPIEGFDSAAMDAELGLADRGLRSLVVVALGYRGTDDFNAKLPKARLAAPLIFTQL
jgi:nitroreductase / dihydropteridine reductase